MDGPASTQPEVRPPSPIIDDHRISKPIDRPSIAQQDGTLSDQQSEGSFDPPEELPPHTSVPTYVQTLMNRELPPREPLRPMINMISSIKPNYDVYLIRIVLGQEGLDMIYLLAYRCSCPADERQYTRTGQRMEQYTS